MKHSDSINYKTRFRIIEFFFILLGRLPPQLLTREKSGGSSNLYHIYINQDLSVSSLYIFTVLTNLNETFYERKTCKE